MTQDDRTLAFFICGMLIAALFVGGVLTFLALHVVFLWDIITELRRINGHG